MKRQYAQRIKRKYSINECKDRKYQERNGKYRKEPSRNSGAKKYNWNEKFTMVSEMLSTADLWF